MSLQVSEHPYLANVEIKEIKEALKDFVLRVSKGNAGAEETKILPAVAALLINS